MLDLDANQAKAAIKTLSKSEITVLYYKQLGLTYPQIGEAMSYSEQRVQQWASGVYKKLGIDGNTTHHTQIKKILDKDFYPVLFEVLDTMPGQSLAEKLENWNVKDTPNPPPAAGTAFLLVQGEVEEEKQRLEEQKQALEEEKQKTKTKNQQEREQKEEKAKRQAEETRQKQLREWEQKNKNKAKRQGPTPLLTSPSLTPTPESERETIIIPPLIPTWVWLGLLILAIGGTFYVAWRYLPRTTEVVVITATPNPTQIIATSNPTQGVVGQVAIPAKPTNTPRPTNTPKPINTSRPISTHTATPTDTATPTETPTPTETVLPGTVVFFDDFNGGDIAPEWVKIGDDKYVLRDGQVTASDSEFWLVLTVNLDNYQVEMEAVSTYAGANNIIAPWFVDTRNYAGLDWSNGVAKWFTSDNGSWSMGEYKETPENSGRATYIIDMIDGVMHVTISGLEFGSFSNPSLPRDKIGLHIFNTASINYFKLTALP